MNPMKWCWAQSIVVYVEGETSLSTMINLVLDLNYELSHRNLISFWFKLWTKAQIGQTIETLTVDFSGLGSIAGFLWTFCMRCYLRAHILTSFWSDNHRTDYIISANGVAFKKESHDNQVSIRLASVRRSKLLTKRKLHSEFSYCRYGD